MTTQTVATFIPFFDVVPRPAFALVYRRPLLNSHHVFFQPPVNLRFFAITPDFVNAASVAILEARPSSRTIGYPNNPVAPVEKGILKPR